MKNISLLALMGISLLAACSTDETNATANTPTQQVEVAASHASCAVSHPSTKGNFVAQANCLTDDETSAMQYDSTDADLTKKLEAGRLVLAKKADAGTITPDQYAQKLHKLEAKIASQKAARHAKKTTAN